MTNELIPTTSYRSLSMKFQWTLSDWRLSPGFITMDDHRQEGKISSPVLYGKAGSEWQFQILFTFVNEGRSKTANVRCYCIKEPRHDGEGCVVRGDFFVTNPEKNSIIKQCKVKNIISSASLLSSAVLSYRDTNDLPNTLIISADFTMYGWKESTHSPLMAVEGNIIFPPESSVAPFLSQLASDVNFADLTIEVEGESIAAHRIVLAARSSVLRAMLTADMKEKNEAKIAISDVSCAAWRIFQKFLYTDAFEPSEECEVALLLEVLLLSDKYEVLSLKSRVGSAILPRLSPENVLDVFEAAQNFDVPGLKEAASDVILKNWETLRKEAKVLTWMSSGSDLAKSLFDKLHF